VHLVGTSYGGYLPVMFALEHPDLLRSVVIGEPGLPGLIENTPGGKQLADERR
jgi:pimeloyl-ACP methyl ester carboxylesterase